MQPEQMSGKDGPYFGDLIMSTDIATSSASAPRGEGALAATADIKLQSKTSLERDGDLLFALFSEGFLETIEFYEKDLGRGEAYHARDKESAVYFGMRKLLEHTLELGDDVRPAAMKGLRTAWESALELMLWCCENVGAARLWRPAVRAFEASITSPQQLQKVERVISRIGMSKSRDEGTLDRQLAFALINDHEGRISESVAEDPSLPRAPLIPLEMQASRIEEILHAQGSQQAIAYYREQIRGSQLDDADGSTMLYFVYRRLIERTVREYSEDPASALTRGPDLWSNVFTFTGYFHDHPELTRGVASPLMRAVEQAREWAHGDLAALRHVWSRMDNSDYRELARGLFDLLPSRRAEAA